MAIGTSLGAYFDDEFHHQAGINTDPSQDRIDVDPDVDPQSTKPKPQLDILPVDKKMPFPDNRNPDTDFNNRFGNLPPSGILNDLKKPDPDRPLLRRINDVSPTNNDQPRLYVSPTQNAPDYDYDAYKKAFPDKEITPESHGPDTFKLPNHITFSNESMYHSDETPGGQWNKKDDGSWSFTPSSFNLQQHSGEELKTYFDKYEKGNELILPDNAAGMAATASGKAVDALKSGKGTPPTIDEDTGINGPILHNIEVGGKRYAITADDRDTAISAAMAASGGGMSVLSKLVHRGSAAEAEAALRPNPQDYVPGHSPEGYNHGPSPFEQVTGASRRQAATHPDSMSDEAFYQYGVRQAPNTMTTEQEARWARIDRTPPSPSLSHESYDDMMNRLDREDQARIETQASTLSFKDYGKVSVADRGYGSFLFKAGDSKVLPLRVSERNGGKTLYVNWIGGTKSDVNAFDKATVKGLFKALADKYPNAEEVAGFRISGARVNSGGGADTAKMRIPGRKQTQPPRKSIEDLSREWDDMEQEMSGVIRNED